MDDFQQACFVTQLRKLAIQQVLDVAGSLSGEIVILRRFDRAVAKPLRVIASCAPDEWLLIETRDQISLTLLTLLLLNSDS